MWAEQGGTAEQRNRRNSPLLDEPYFARRFLIELFYILVDLTVVLPETEVGF